MIEKSVLFTFVFLLGGGGVVVVGLLVVWELGGVEGRRREAF